jgi:hypothetical protein
VLGEREQDPLPRGETKCEQGARRENRRHSWISFLSSCPKLSIAAWDWDGVHGIDSDWRKIGPSFPVCRLRRRRGHGTNEFQDSFVLSVKTALCPQDVASSRMMLNRNVPRARDLGLFKLSEGKDVGGKRGSEAEECTGERERDREGWEREGEGLAVYLAADNCQRARIIRRAEGVVD